MTVVLPQVAPANSAEATSAEMTSADMASALAAALASDIAQAAAVLEAGGLVAFPTETVYGLGADAENPRAVAAIYAAKGRPSDHPVIVHLAPDADLAYWASAIPPQAHQLVAAFWPGPLTLILKRAPGIPAAVSGGQDTVGLRCPSHPVAQALLRAFKGGRGGVAAPSANKFGHVSPTTAAHVREEFGLDAPERLAGAAPLASAAMLVLDGGQSEVGIESTIVDLSRMDSVGPVLLRPGQIGAAQIAEVIGQMPAAIDARAPRASGTLDAHYAPQTPVVLVEGNVLATTLQQLHAAGRRVALAHLQSLSMPAGVLASISMSPAVDAYAHDLYAALRQLDRAGADLILFEAPPADSHWQGVNDRLRRAAHDSKDRLSSLIFQ